MYTLINDVTQFKSFNTKRVKNNQERSHKYLSDRKSIIKIIIITFIVTKTNSFCYLSEQHRL